MTWTIPGTLDAVGETALEISATLHHFGIDDDLIYAVELCFEELAVNIVRHGHQSQPHQPDGAQGGLEIQITLENHPDRCILTLSDNGEMFDVASASPRKIRRPLSDVTPGGLGIHLVKEYATSLRYQREAEHNRVTVEFGK